MEKLEIIYKNISEIKPYKHNAKLHPAEHIAQIAKSIQDFGFNDPIAVDEDGVIIEGHGRLEAAKKLGMDTIPVIVLDGLTDQQKKAYILAHNQLTMNTGFDLDILADELSRITAFNMEEFGFVDEPEKEELPEEKTKVDLTETLPDSKVMVCTVSTFGTNTELFVEVVLPQETANHFLDNYFKLDPDQIAERLKETIDAL